MFSWGLWLAYGFMALYVARMFYGNCVIGHDKASSWEPMGIDKGGWVLCALFGGLLWPLGIIYLAITYKAPKSRYELDRIEKELKDRERRISQLEKELGIHK